MKKYIYVISISLFGITSLDGVVRHYNRNHNYGSNNQWSHTSVSHLQIPAEHIYSGTAESVVHCLHEQIVNDQGRGKSLFKWCILWKTPARPSGDINEAIIYKSLLCYKDEISCF